MPPISPTSAPPWAPLDQTGCRSPVSGPTADELDALMTVRRLRVALCTASDQFDPLGSMDICCLVLIDAGDHGESDAAAGRSAIDEPQILPTMRVESFPRRIVGGAASQHRHVTSQGGVVETSGGILRECESVCVRIRGRCGDGTDMTVRETEPLGMQHHETGVTTALHLDIRHHRVLDSIEVDGVHRGIGDSSSVHREVSHRGRAWAGPYDADVAARTRNPGERAGQ